MLKMELKLDRAMIAVLALIFALMYGCSAHAQTSTISGTIKDRTDAVATSGKVTFTPIPDLPTTTGIAIYTSQTVECGINGSGLIKNLALSGNCVIQYSTALNPAGTSYRICFWPFFTKTSCLNAFIYSATTDLSTVVPVPSTMPIFSFMDLASNQTVNGNKTFGGTATFTLSPVFTAGISQLFTSLKVTLLTNDGTADMSINPAVSASTGRNVLITAGMGTGANPGFVIVRGGLAAGAFDGGGATLVGGIGSVSGGISNGGQVNVVGGQGGTSGGHGGSVLIGGGTSLGNNNNGGVVTLLGGNPNGAGTPGWVQVQDQADSTKKARFTTGPIATGTTALVGLAYTATASLDFDLSGAGITCQDLTITVTGAVDADPVSIGIPNALASTAGVLFSSWVSAANTVTVRACDATSGNPNPAAATVRATVWKF